MDRIPYYAYPILTDPLAAYKSRREWFITAVKQVVEFITSEAAPIVMEKVTYWQQDAACRSVSRQDTPSYQCWNFRYSAGDKTPACFSDEQWLHFTALMKKFCNRQDGELYVVRVYQFDLPDNPCLIDPFESTAWQGMTS